MKDLKKFDLFDDGEIYKNHNIQEFYVESLRARQLIESEATKLAILNATSKELQKNKIYLPKVNRGIG
uniref:GntR family transcriptional regulator n=1 Tax=Clostridioides difficile TaxID=1496 RepID=A0A381I890_CLODI|nr:GntR family transcriptional regulator [Clostridioides difficile]